MTGAVSPWGEGAIQAKKDGGHQVSEATGSMLGQ